MKEALLILTMAAIFLFLYFVIRKLDIFLNENHSSIQKESEKKEPSFVMLTDELSDEEITSEVHHFRLKHQNAKIVLYDNHDDMISAMNNRKMSANRKYKTNRQA